MPFGFWVLGLGCRVKGLWFRKGLRVEGARFRIQGSGFKEWNKVLYKLRSMCANASFRAI